MADERSRKKEQGDSGDNFTDKIRSLPRMRAQETGDQKEYVAPPPTLVRIGAASQGCTGILLTLLAIPMVMVSLWSGYYLWGPGVFLVSGLALVAASIGIWRGRRLPLVMAIGILVGLAIVAYFWTSFIPAVAVLSPLGQFSLLYDPVVRILAFLLFATLIVHGISVFYWRRLHPWPPRVPILWLGVLIVVIGSIAILNFTQINQIKGTLEDNLKDWTAEAASDTVTLGANVEVTLGSSFLTGDAETDPRLEVRLAELRAVVDTAASPIRLKASGDMWLEEENPILFSDAPSDDDSTPEPLTEEEVAEAMERIERQKGYEAQYLTALQASGAELYVADSFSSQYLLTQSTLYDPISWEDFTTLHAERIRRYAEALQPAAYEIISEPSVYEQYSGLEEVEDEDEYLENWLTHTENLVAIVEEASPETLVGVSLWLDDEFDVRYYKRVLEMDGIDFIGVRVFQLSDFDELTESLEEMGHPQDSGKQLWIVETWYGYCLAPQRSMDIDVDWLETSVAYAAKESVGAVFTKDLGCFIEPGGTLFADEIDVNDRTGVFEAWRDLVAQWSGS